MMPQHDSLFSHVVCFAVEFRRFGSLGIVIFPMLQTWTLLVSGNSCPNFDMSGDARYNWQCAVGLNKSSGLYAFEDHCIETLKQRIFWGYEGEDICDHYWGDETRSGLWPRLIEQHGGDSWITCNGQRMQRRMSRKSPAEVSRWTPKDWVAFRLKIAKGCITPDICEFENSHFGMCSGFYDKEILPNCTGESGGMQSVEYRDGFCSEICPPPPEEPDDVQESNDLVNGTILNKTRVNGTSLNETSLNESSLNETSLNETFVNSTNDSPQKVRQPKCPVTRFAFKAKAKAKQAVSKMMTWMSRLLPALLGPPTPPPPSDVNSTEQRSERLEVV